jgi:maltose alpha-D-glucosyltransferase/alpha-amylase
MTYERHPLWYKDAIIYQLHVKAYSDSKGDGMGDFRGLTDKLDYLGDLGVSALWLLPFYPSPLRDDGYDISDYTGVHPSYGTLRDFKTFLREAHQRGLQVITELVVNHTSDQHPWFQRARRAKPGTKWRDFYVWSETPEKFKEARIIFKDFEPSNWAWDPVGGSYYWHRFYSHQPDLNYDSLHVHEAIFKALDFWLEMGVDGLRLDAVPYLYEREGTNCENLPETHAFLKKMRTHVDRRYENRMFLGEANQWPEDAAAYFGEGDECHVAFHFPLMPRLFMALRMEDRFPIVDILDQTPAIPESCQWAIFLRNHDELTLEMVTDEERDYMYRVYAQDPQMRINLGIRRRLAPLLGNHRRRIELMNGLLFSMPGTPVIYYGDEIGMGDNIYLGDRDAVRTPMQWSIDRNAGFSRANPQKLYLPIIIDPEYHYEVINVEAQQSNPHSLLWWMRRLIALRKRFKAFGRGTIEFLKPENHKIIAFLRKYEDERILVVANLSRFVQHVTLDLSAYKGCVPVELIGRIEFPPVGESPYFLSFGPHSFYWFSLESGPPDGGMVGDQVRPEEPAVLTVTGKWDAVLRDQTSREGLERILPSFLARSRWFGGKARAIKRTVILNFFELPQAETSFLLVFLQVFYMDGDAETYLIPLTFSKGPRSESILQETPDSAIARLQFREDGATGLLYDGMVDPDLCRDLLTILGRRRRIKAGDGELVISTTDHFRRLSHGTQEPLTPLLVKAEQSNTSVIYGDRFILKLIRRFAPGINPDLEISRFLTEKRFPHAPVLAGAMEYTRPREEPLTLAILEGFVPNQGDAWRFTQDSLCRFLETLLARKAQLATPIKPKDRFPDPSVQAPPDALSEMIGTYFADARLLGQRTAELHLCLASSADRPQFAPEPFTKLYQRSLYQSMRALATQVFSFLRRRLQNLSEPSLDMARRILDSEASVMERFRTITTFKTTAQRIRCHGDYHLGQVLHTGNDFVIIDFEGEPARPISERRIKRSPLRDVAGMLRSFHYAAYSAFFNQHACGVIVERDMASLEAWIEAWHQWAGGFFLDAYLSKSREGHYLPESQEEIEVLLEAYLLEKAIYELGYELNNRPEWVRIPLQGILDLISEGQ